MVTQNNNLREINAWQGLQFLVWAISSILYIISDNLACTLDLAYGLCLVGILVCVKEVIYSAVDIILSYTWILLEFVEF